MIRQTNIWKIIQNWINSLRPDKIPSLPQSSRNCTTEESGKKANKKPSKTKTDNLLQELQSFMETTYDFRFNLLTEETEYRTQGTKAGAAYRIADQRALNSLCMEAKTRGIACWDRDISRYIHSYSVKEYHPFTSYMDNLPDWDGTDRLENLARRVSGNPLWMKGFRRWMLAMTAQWMQLDHLHGNSVAPVLISRKQGRQKSTFCKLLLPAALQRYYTDSIDLNAPTQMERKLSLFGLVNLDEFDKIPPKKMPLLKNLMQMAELNIRKAYQKSYASLPRMASFIATSNQKELLSDPSGSRRFLCIEVEEKIDCSPIDHDQVYAQLKTCLSGGEPILVHLQRRSRNHGIERQVLQADHRRRHLPFLLPPSIEKRASPTPLSRRDIRTYEKTKSRSHAGHNRQPDRLISQQFGNRTGTYAIRKPIQGHGMGIRERKNSIHRVHKIYLNDKML